MVAGLCAGMIKFILTSAKIAQDFKKDLRKIEAMARRGVTLARNEAGDGLKLALRQDTLQAGLGKKIEKSWQSRRYPKTGDSMNAAVQVFSKAPKIIAAYDRGVLIQAGGGKYLAIPTENAPKKGVDRKRISPASWPEHRFGPLRLVKTKSGNLLLVADNLRASYSRKTGEMRGYRKASASARRRNKGLTTVVMFILIRQVRIPKKLDVEREFNKWAAAFPVLITRNLRNAYKK